MRRRNGRCARSLRVLGGGLRDTGLQEGVGAWGKFVLSHFAREGSESLRLNMEIKVELLVGLGRGG